MNTLKYINCSLSNITSNDMEDCLEGNVVLDMDHFNIFIELLKGIASALLVKCW